MRERLSICKGMVEAVWDGGNRKSGAHRKRDAGPPKRIPPDPQPQQQKDRQETQERIPTLCSTTGFWAAWEWSLLSVDVAICCTWFTNCCPPSRGAKTVAGCSQTVCRRLHIAKKTRDSLSRPLLAISFVSEEAIQVTSMDTTPQPHRRKSRSDLVHLRSLSLTQPGTKIGQVIWAWAEIEAGLAAGMKLKEVWEAATRDGMEMSYAQFRVYISSLRRRRQRSIAREPQPRAAPATGERRLPAPPPPDPFTNLREQREKKDQSGFEYDPFSINGSPQELVKPVFSLSFRDWAVGVRFGSAAWKVSRRPCSPAFRTA